MDGFTFDALHDPYMVGYFVAVPIEKDNIADRGRVAAVLPLAPIFEPCNAVIT